MFPRVFTRYAHRARERQVNFAHFQAKQLLTSEMLAQIMNFVRVLYLTGRLFEAVVWLEYIMAGTFGRSLDLP